MNKKLLLTCIMLYPITNHAMKRKFEPECTVIIQKRQRTETINNFNYTGLPTDLKLVILHFMTTNSSTKKVKNAISTVNALYKTNKFFYASINAANFQKNLINNFAKNFYCSHETIAHNLKTQTAKKYLHLQYKLKHLCLFNTNKNVTTELDGLIQQNINLTFTYNYDNMIQTPLMIAVKGNKHIFKALLTHVDINDNNTHGLTLLKYLTTFPIQFHFMNTILKFPTLIIDQQNHHGETALLRCLVRRQTVKPTKRFSLTFSRTIKKLLAAGADPEQANNYGLTPLTAAKDLGNQEIIDIIQDAIDEKHAK